MFRDERQRSLVCAKLTDWMGKGPLWTEDGPTELGRATRLENPWSSGEKMMVAIAWSFYNDENPTPCFGGIVNRLDEPRLVLLGTLMIALANNQIDVWLKSRLFVPMSAVYEYEDIK